MVFRALSANTLPQTAPARLPSPTHTLSTTPLFCPHWNDTGESVLWFAPGTCGSCLRGLPQPLWPQHPCSVEQVEQVDPEGFSLSSPLRQCSSLCMIEKMKLLTGPPRPFVAGFLPSCQLSMHHPSSSPDPSCGPCPCGLLSHFTSGCTSELPPRCQSDLCSGISFRESSQD